MRIAYMLTSLGIGGAERQVVALAERMAARGHDVLLIVLQGMFFPSMALFLGIAESMNGRRVCA